MTPHIPRLNAIPPTIPNLHPTINPLLRSSFPVEAEADGIVHTHAALFEPLYRILITWFTGVEIGISSEKTLIAIMDEGDRTEAAVDVVLTALQKQCCSMGPKNRARYGRKNGLVSSDPMGKRWETLPCSFLKRGNT
jgi:hypothetical protein